MKGAGSRVENETVIIFNETDELAIINTASPTVYRRMVKRGFKPALETAFRARFELPKRLIRLPSQPRARLSPEAISRQAARLKTARLRRAVA